MLFIILTACIAMLLYLYHVNRGIMAVPEEARRACSHRWTVDEIKAAFEKVVNSPTDVAKSLPPKQHRRYIVVGGSGLVGNWIVSHLLMRGEDPAAIRILDIQTPRSEVLDQGVAFTKTNITDEQAVLNAFSQPWDPSVADLPLTVFHNAAVIRPGDRLKAFLPLCRNVNVGGTVNVLNAAKKSGATCMIATSSGSVCLRRFPLWIPPWAKTPKNLVQVVNDSSEIPKEHDDYFGNYAVAKAEAENIVRSADDLKSNFRTGCIRPVNGIYGISDSAGSVMGNYLRSGGGPTWTYDVIHHFVNAENVSIAHLLYEQRLVEHSNSPSTLPNIGGQAFAVTDPNPPISFNDMYLVLKTFAKTPIVFPHVPVILFILMSYPVEWYAFVQHQYLPWLPKVTGELAQLQPGLFAISNAHVIADDSRARLSPEKGGLGYNPPLTTLEGMCKEVKAWNEKAAKKGSS
ncbi:3-beta hydroxysteroid dehydrogenase/isomerase family protein [Aspergillus nomiae NRRL 13137]|uniref:3-beta hydroxysteroid dehydrogenase/isomerase family protein n=1 Tax=Aspergillus nomiae NRRL (strain ATCC 15546 / NRRL 13137 / CBS 260.88 / M93) TaxID=1509407 RepID=A0A0L1IYC4_ASPN3|nr:3-beta hydroxysteroid dehydrogenase/isomerase family protein [Aspergillus nomiae NRRL 13137]KNG84556.1 3-beta hydroxysteroid dehydrogenase/isomerase family protein [Aspergillus nomiae NRRL 13137]